MMNAVMMLLAGGWVDGMLWAWGAPGRDPFMIVWVVTREHTVNKKNKAISNEKQQIRQRENAVSIERFSFHSLYSSIGNSCSNISLEQSCMVRMTIFS